MTKKRQVTDKDVEDVEVWLKELNHVEKTIKALITDPKFSNPCFKKLYPQHQRSIIKYLTFCAQEFAVLANAACMLHNVDE